MPPWQFIEAAQGANVANAAIATAKITNTGGSGAAFDAGSYSNETIAGDGFVELVAGALANKAIGLSDESAGQDHTDIVHALYCDSSANLYIRENGAIVAGPTAYVTGDVLRVARVGSVVTYYKNGERLHTSVIVSATPLRIDSAFFDAGALFDAIRFYDGTAKAFVAPTWVNVNTAIAAGAAATTRRLTFTAPTKMRAGDQLVVLLGSQGAEFVSATNVTWEPIHTFASETRRRGFAIYRRAATDSEPASYTFDLNVHQVTLGALLVYRDVDTQSALVAGDADDISATTLLQTPTVAVQRPSDLFIGGALVYNPQAQTVTPPAGATERLEFTGNAPIGVDVLLSLYDMPTPYVGNTRATATISGLPAGASPSSFAFVLPGNPALGQGLAWKPLVAGAIGLPVEGI